MSKSEGNSEISFTRKFGKISTIKLNPRAITVTLNAVTDNGSYVHHARWRASMSEVIRKVPSCDGLR